MMPAGNRVGLYERAGGGIPLQGVEVDAEVVGGYARVTVRQRYRNDAPRAVEAVYTFPLPADATLTGFAMTADGRTVTGVVQSRDEAFRTYDNAVVSGHGAALLEQERPNVFTASVGNLLPGEVTVVELSYLQRVTADEGTLRWMLPTLVAPRYIPGVGQGDRTGDGSVGPTDRVPDADRITPRAGAVDYGLTLSLVFDLGRDLEVESPSHPLTVTRDGRRVRVRFAQHDVALDRDVVVTARGVGDGPLAGVATHRVKGAEGYLALTVVPDLFAAARAGAARQDVVFLIDTSGSMEGASIAEARSALRLCLRHLREGDRFNVVAFASGHTTFAPALVPYTQRTLEQADAWVSGLTADGGTEILRPMMAAMEMARDGVLVLLTDGQVGNEDEILRGVLGARGRARVYSFGIGTNVSDALLRDLARQTGGAVEFIHPGERIDEKVVGVFARAVAARVTGVAVRFENTDVGELAPGTLPDLVDGEPWMLSGRYGTAGGGRALVTGSLNGRDWSLAVPLDLPEETSRPVVATLWAAERVRDLEASAVRSGRSAEAMKDRIVALAVEHGIASRYTSFVVVEKRTGDRRTQGQPETRTIPVNLPAGWAPSSTQDKSAGGGLGGWVGHMVAGALGMPQAFAPMGSMPPMRGAYGGGPRPRPSPAPAALARAAPLPVQGAAPPVPQSATPPPAARPGAGAPVRQREKKATEGGTADHVLAVLGRQLASGLWDDGGTGDESVRRVRATRDALLVLLRAGVDTSHALHGAQVRKAVEALLLAVTGERGIATALVETSLAVAWLVTTGRRTQAEISAAVAAVPGLTALLGRLGDRASLREWLDKTGA